MYRVYWKPTKVNHRGMLGRSITVQVTLSVIVVIAIFSLNERDIRSVIPFISTRITHIGLSWQFRS